MLYNDKIIFLHIPKTSGNTFHKSFSINTNGIAHDSLLDNLQMLKTRKSFSFIRHPYDWYKSIYSYLYSENNKKDKTWGVLQWKDINSFVKSCTEQSCNNLVFLKNRLRVRETKIGDICKTKDIGLFSAIFLEQTSIHKDLSINRDHIFFEIESFYKFYGITAKRNKSNSNSVFLSKESKELIDKYDMPTYREFLKQVSTDYDIF